MPKYVDIGRKIDDAPVSAAASPKHPRRVYDSFTVPEDLVKHFENMEVGDECEARVRLRKKSHELASPWSSSKKPTVSMELCAIAMDDKDDKNDDSGFDLKKKGY